MDLVLRLQNLGVSHWLRPAFKNEKDSIEKELKGWGYSSVLSIWPAYVRLWVQAPSSQGKEKEKKKHFENYRKDFKIILLSYTNPV